MSYKSHAYLKTNATPARIKALLRDLTSYDCAAHLHYGAKRLDLEVAEHMERWIVLGGLARLLERYHDILAWQPNFTRDESVRHLPEHVFKSSELRH